MIVEFKVNVIYSIIYLEPSKLYTKFKPIEARTYLVFSNPFCFRF